MQGQPMTVKKFVTTAFAATLLFALACGKGKEAAEKQQEGVDDQAPQVTATTTAESAASAAPAAAAPAVADAATISGTVKLAGNAPKMPAIQMSADTYCSSQHPSGQGAVDEEVVVGPAGELANVLVYIKNPPPGNYATPSTPA